MEIKVNSIDKEIRKEMVGRIAEALEEKAVYLRAPSYGYRIGEVMVGRYGDIECSEDDGALILLTLNNMGIDYKVPAFMEDDTAGDESDAADEQYETEDDDSAEVLENIDEAPAEVEPEEMVELIEEVSSEPVIEDTIAVSPTDAQKQKKVSIAKQAANMVLDFLNGAHKKEAMEVLTNADNTKDAFGVRYAFLKKVTDNPDDRKVKGAPRYSSNPIEIDGVSYWVTNDLYQRNIPKIKKWIESLN